MDRSSVYLGSLEGRLCALRWGLVARRGLQYGHSDVLRFRRALWACHALSTAWSGLWSVILPRPLIMPFSVTGGFGVITRTSPEPQSLSFM